QFVECGVERIHVGHVAIDEQIGIELLGQRLDALEKCLPLIGEGQLRAMRMQGLGDAPGKRLVVGKPHDESALASHKARHMGCSSVSSAGSPSSGNSASAALSSAPITTPSPMMKKKMSVTIVPARPP